MTTRIATKTPVFRKQKLIQYHYEETFYTATCRYRYGSL